MKSIVMDMRFVFLAILLAMFTQTLTSGLPLWQMGDSFVAMSLVVFASLVTKRYLPSSLPAFAYATIIGILICLPETPVRGLFMDAVAKISFQSSAMLTTVHPRCGASLSATTRVPLLVGFSSY